MSTIEVLHHAGHIQNQNYLAVFRFLMEYPFCLKKNTIARLRHHSIGILPCKLHSNTTGHCTQVRGIVDWLYKRLVEGFLQLVSAAISKILRANVHVLALSPADEFR